MGIHIFVAVAAVLATTGLVAAPGEGRCSAVRCTQTGSMSLLQAASQTSKTATSESVSNWQRLEEQVIGTGGRNSSAWAHEAAQRGRALLQAAQSVLGAARSHSAISLSWAAVPFLVMAFCGLTVGIAFLLTQRWQPASHHGSTSRDDRRFLRAGTERHSLESVRLPADALKHRGYGKAGESNTPSPPRLLGRTSPDQKTPQASPEDRYGKMDSEAEFSPDLIVPRGCECILLVPVVPLSMGPFDICDPNGEVVLRVLPKSNGSPPESPEHPSILRGRARDRRQSSCGPAKLGPSWRLELTSGQGALLGQTSCSCTNSKRRNDSEGSNQPVFQLFRASGGYYASLQRNAQGYELATPGMTIHFWGSFDHYAVNITDEAGGLLATTELSLADFDPSGEYYCLRVAPLVDVGLLLCSLICIDQERELSRRT